jgi:hypothetical protein
MGGSYANTTAAQQALNGLGVPAAGIIAGVGQRLGNMEPAKLETAQTMQRMAPVNLPDQKKETYQAPVEGPIRNMAYINAEAAAPLTAKDKADKQHEAQQLEQFSTLFSNQDSPNPTGRDASLSEYMKAKTYKKPLNAGTADYPDGRN